MRNKNYFEPLRLLYKYFKTRAVFIIIYCYGICSSVKTSRNRPRNIKHTPITSSGAFSLPWTVPAGFDTGTYTITVSDDENSSSLEIFIQ